MSRKTFKTQGGHAISNIWCQFWFSFRLASWPFPLKNIEGPRGAKVFLHQKQAGRIPKIAKKHLKCRGGHAFVDVWCQFWFSFKLASWPFPLKNIEGPRGAKVFLHQKQAGRIPKIAKKHLKCRGGHAFVDVWCPFWFSFKLASWPFPLKNIEGPRGAKVFLHQKQAGRIPKIAKKHLKCRGGHAFVDVWCQFWFSFKLASWPFPLKNIEGPRGAKVFLHKKQAGRIPKIAKKHLKCRGGHAFVDVWCQFWFSFKLASWPFPLKNIEGPRGAKVFLHKKQAGRIPKIAKKHLKCRGGHAFVDVWCQFWFSFKLASWPFPLKNIEGPRGAKVFLHQKQAGRIPKTAKSHLKCRGGHAFQMQNKGGPSFFFIVLCSPPKRQNMRKTLQNKGGGKLFLHCFVLTAEATKHEENVTKQGGAKLFLHCFVLTSEATKHEENVTKQGGAKLFLH